MTSALVDRLLPQQQRRTLEELSADLDLSSGDRASKVSAFWTMLLLSGVIASAGVLSDSTATVIGAMIIAPLSTPIMGIGLAFVVRDGVLARRSALAVVSGAAAVVAIGAVCVWLIPGSVDLLANSQITSRTSPSLIDLVAAVATGMAGAVALARRDVAAVLPGVAIAISLVPPLVVVGVCAGEGAFSLAIGALVLFGSNFVSLVLAGTLVFTLSGYAQDAHNVRNLSARKAYLTISLLLVLVLVPLVTNSVGTWLIATWTQRVEDAASAWVSAEPGASVTDVQIVSSTAYVTIQTPSTVPPVDALLTDLKGQVPAGIRVVVKTSLGRQIDVGQVQ